jgi:hypothetical protein
MLGPDNYQVVDFAILKGRIPDIIERITGWATAPIHLERWTRPEPATR